MPFDILGEDPFGFNLGNNAGDVGPKVSRIVPAFAVPGKAERLAGITGRDEMNSVTP
jgi:hypothetical protein